jgi:hypothetical protein
MAVLNAIFGLARWSQAVVIHSYSWLENFLMPYVGGHLDNISAALVLIASGYNVPVTTSSSGDLVQFSQSLDPPGDGEMQLYSSESESCDWYAIWCHGARAAESVWNWAGDALGDIWQAILGALEWIIKAIATIIDLITYAIRFLWDLLRRVVTFLWDLLQAVLELLRIARDAVTGIVTDWNDAEPVTPPGLEDCDIDPQTKDLCVVWWVMQETIFSGTQGQLLIPLLTSIFGIVAALLLAYKIRDLLILTNRNTQ